MTFLELSWAKLKKQMVVGVLLLGAASFLAGQDIENGRKQFAAHCSMCHGADGNGGELGPGIVSKLPAHDDPSLVELIPRACPLAACPRTNWRAGKREIWWAFSAHWRRAFPPLPGGAWRTLEADRTRA